MCTPFVAGAMLAATISFCNFSKPQHRVFRRFSHQALNPLSILPLHLHTMTRGDGTTRRTKKDKARRTFEK